MHLTGEACFHEPEVYFTSLACLASTIQSTCCNTSWVYLQAVKAFLEAEPAKAAEVQFLRLKNAQLQHQIDSIERKLKDSDRLSGRAPQHPCWHASLTAFRQCMSRPCKRGISKDGESLVFSALSGLQHPVEGGKPTQLQFEIAAF